MPAWFDDYLACAPLARWLPTQLGAGARRLGAMPRALRGVLAGVEPLADGDDPIPALVVLDSFDLAPAVDVRAAFDRLAPGGVVVELARVRTFASMLAPRRWRRDHLLGGTAERAAAWIELGLGDLQQWVCDEPVAMVVTLGRRA